MSALPPHFDSAGPQTLAGSTLPRRVRRVLEHVLSSASDELERHLGQMLAEFEQQLFRLADHARNPAVESGYMQTLRTARLNRADLIPRFMAKLEASLAALGRPTSTTTGTAEAAAPADFHNMRLMDEADLDEDAALREIAVRQESRASLPLHLLGQRFGVLAAAPAFDAERLPLGPQSLCRILREASQSLQVSLESRLLLYRIFERRVMTHYPQLVEMLNVSIAADGVLPSLTYVPIRLRPTSVAESEAGAAALAPDSKSKHRSGMPLRGADRNDAQRPHTAWLGEGEAPGTDFDENAAFNLLQQLLSGRRDLIGKLRPDAGGGPPQQLSTQDVVGALGGLQTNAASPTGTPRSLLDVKQTVLAQARQQRGHGASFSREDNDTFELLGMLYAQIEREVRGDTPAAALLQRLQVPLLRVALQDRAFFVRPQHPARELLNAVAESGARWLDRDDLDPQLLAPLQQAVSHVVENYDGDSAVFDASNRQLQTQLRNLARKAEMAERRYVEAARGKEKLEIAKRRAADTITQMIGEQRLPRFGRALLNQAWADVLTLTLLRQGGDSDEWREQLDTTSRIVASCCRSGGESAKPDQALATRIETALGQVGYHAEEAAAIARRLTSVVDDDEEDPASRTELTMKLKARTRLGEDAAEQRRPTLQPRNPEEQARYDQLRVMPFGAWVEFITNQQGDVVRRRLSWYSTVTDNALFVNQRGQRVGEQTLDSLARMLVRGQARIVTAERGRLVDRAWHATLNALRSFAGGGRQLDPEPAT